MGLLKGYGLWVMGDFWFMAILVHGSWFMAFLVHGSRLMVND